MPNKISAESVKKLRDGTGVGMMEAKNALTEADGDVVKAQEILRKKGQLKAAKKTDRPTGQGLVHAYIHGDGRIGVLVEVNCETDFVARNDEFKALVHDLALHVAAANPLYLSRTDVPAEVVEKEKEIYRESADLSGKPKEIIEKIITGKLEKFYQDACLLEQPFIRDGDVNIQELVTHKIATIGENIQIHRFTRYVLGE